MNPINDQPIEEFIAERRKQVFDTGLSWGHFYELTANSVVLDNRPDYWQTARKGNEAFRRRLEQTGTEAETDNHVQLVVQSLGHLPMYVNYGWETGIFNEYRHLQMRGFSRHELMELILYGQLQAGIRGLQHTYNAVSKLLPGFEPGVAPSWYPRGWAPDNAAFHAGLDLSQRKLTDQDRSNVTAWYEKTVGFVPDSVLFAIEFHPEFYKWHRARWEVIFQLLPKQVAPYVMLRLQAMTGFEGAIREAALLGKAWGIGREWVNHAMMVSAWYTGFEELYGAHAAIDDILENWD